MCQTLQKLNIRLTALVMAAMLIFCVLPSASAVETGGTCGPNLTWSYADGRLTITGSGDMTDYSQYNMAPWFSFRDQITTLSLPEGMTSVGELAFYDCTNLLAVSIPSTVTDIGQLAFCQCTSVNILSLNEGLRTIGRSAFELCQGLQDLRIPNTVTTLGGNAFYRCESLRYVTVPASVTSMGSGVFAYCEDLICAEILAPLDALPTWTFYGCINLSSISLDAQTKRAEKFAVYGCENLNTVYYGGSEGDVEQLRDSITEDRNDFANYGEIFSGESTNSGSTYDLELNENGEVIIENTTVEQTDDATISVSTTTNGSNPADVTGQNSTNITATVINPEGWDQLSETIQKSSGEVNVAVFTSGDADVPQTVIEALAGKHVNMKVQTLSGAQYSLNFSTMGETESEGTLDLSYSLTRLTEIKYESLAQVEAYQLNFNSSSVVAAEVMIQLPLDNAYKKATLYQEDGKELTLLQSVVVDAEGFAHFYLGAVDKETTYLIGIDVPGIEQEAVIIPQSLYSDYGVTDAMANVEYVITGRTSSWGMSMGQVTWILAGVMVVSVVGVGVVMFALNKRRLKMGYVPDYDDDEDE